jgi:flagellar motor switch protein FliM
MSDGALSQTEIDALLAGADTNEEYLPEYKKQSREDYSNSERIRLLEHEVEALQTILERINKDVSDIKKSILGEW